MGVSSLTMALKFLLASWTLARLALVFRGGRAGGEQGSASRWSPGTRKGGEDELPKARVARVMGLEGVSVLLEI